MIIAEFPEGIDEITVEGLAQWDKGRKLKIVMPSLPDFFQVHFANRNSKTAQVVPASSEDGVCIVNIPNIIPIQPADAIAWIYDTPSAEVGRTIARINLPMWKRAKPESYVYEETETLGYDILEERIIMLNAVNEEQTEQIEKNSADIADLKYVPIDVTSVSYKIDALEKGYIEGSVVENGSVVSAVTISWNVNKEPESQMVENEEVVPTARSKALTGLSITANKKFTVSATDERDHTDQGSATMYFRDCNYYGAVDSVEVIDSALILGLKKKLATSRALSFNTDAGNGKRIVYAFPSSYGAPKFKIGGYDSTDDFYKAKTFEFENAFGYKKSYDVWVSVEVLKDTVPVVVE